MATEDRKDGECPSYSQFACIGTGFSAIGLGATLKRWYGITDVRFFERHLQLGGTWFVNQYPGAACDVPSALYSFSFEPNPEWTRPLPYREELWAYLKRVADKYDLPRRMTFGVNVERCEWIEERSVWRLHVRDQKTDSLFVHESQFLFAATGQLVQPREIDIPGAETFKGPIFHSARWRHDVDLTGKKVVLFGNGCTAAQIVPSIVDKTAHLTQVVRTKHWVYPFPVDAASQKIMKWITKYVPGSMLLQRFIVFNRAEQAFRDFYMTDAGAKFRAKKRAQIERYMRSKAPEKYHDILIPDFEIGCKRRIFDPGYLASLHSPNLTLTDAPVLEILPHGVRTTQGVIEADAIVLANGFETGNYYFGGASIVGRDGETAGAHWARLGGAGAYNCSAMSGFPNFFALLGPNSATGHTSALIAVENSINYALRIIKPVLDGEARAAEVRLEAERAYVERIQGDLQKMVFASGCGSWYVKDVDGGRQWNAATYPWTQAYFWYRSLFPVWRDWTYSLWIGTVQGQCRAC
ncbi:FAD/NAD(P)-binding domain-containing protein [Coniochaeta ligniaria NRRL 30616]|uniref:FAD/NAD(P)-binding domain-containing protein n=1 Tax=Coniochaeta ligniaria NRRL 30616 TaxID=1408157 RepID=A0A1J7I5Q2_9PEZI|nr:FAD/NAD(P)-binding domain-containing protein [Coniochaeta ligniaria NRRL 30616]